MAGGRPLASPVFSYILLSMVGLSGNEPASSHASEDGGRNPEDYGILLGWTADDLGDRLVLKMQSARAAPKSDDDIREFTYFLKRDQAVLLGNFLFRMSGETAPTPPPRGLFNRLFGRP